MRMCLPEQLWITAVIVTMDQLLLNQKSTIFCWLWELVELQLLLSALLH